MRSPAWQPDIWCELGKQQSGNLGLLLSVSLRWIKLPPVWTNSQDHVREVPYMRYGHSAVLIDDTIYIWGGRNDTEGACNVLYAFDVSKCRLFALPQLECSETFPPLSLLTPSGFPVSIAVLPC